MQESDNPVRKPGDVCTVSLPFDEFICRFRDISFLRQDRIVPTIENVRQILTDAGVERFTAREDCICLRPSDEPFLEELTRAINEQKSPAKNQPSTKLKTESLGRKSSSDSSYTTRSSTYTHDDFTQTAGATIRFKRNDNASQTSSSPLTIGIHTKSESPAPSEAMSSRVQSSLQTTSISGATYSTDDNQSITAVDPYPIRRSRSHSVSLPNHEISDASSSSMKHSSSFRTLSADRGSRRSSSRPSSSGIGSMIDSYPNRHSSRASIRSGNSFKHSTKHSGTDEKHIVFGHENEKAPDSSYRISQWMNHYGPPQAPTPDIPPPSVSARTPAPVTPPPVPPSHATNDSQEKFEKQSLAKMVEKQMQAANERKVLDPRWWDRFQMMPREQVSSSATFQAVFRFFKVICYMFFIIALVCSAAISKLCVLLMTSGITKDPQPENNWPAKTQLVISMCFPYGIWFLVYSAKSLFGSTAWPSLPLLTSALLVELLHTLGMCLLVFRVLPLLDMLRALILLASIYTIPAFLKTVFEGRDPNISLSRKCSMFMLNCGAFLIQIGSIVLCLMYQIPMTPDEKLAIRNKVLRDNIEVMVPRPMLREGYFGNSIVYELPLALILISLAYWENFVDDDIEICGRVLAFRSWKKHLHHTRGRLYIFVSVWKALWVVAFAILLQPGFNFNLHYTQDTISSNKTGTSNETLLNTTLLPVASNMSINTIETDTFVEENPIALPQRSMFKRQAEGESILEYPVYGDYGAGNAGGGSATVNPLVRLTEPTVNIENDTKKSLNITRSLKDLFKLSKQTIRHFELYGIVYIQIISSSLTTYFGSTACKLCMQLMGFSLPLMLILPVSVAFIVLQCVYQFLPTGVFIWVGVETGSNTWILHLAWLGVVWLSEVYIVSHIWFPSNGRMERIDRLFVTPVRCGILPDQSLMLRRRRNDQDTSLLPDVDDESYDPEALQYKADDVVPQIYACATMWHETRAEMTNLLKSLFRMDIDHSGRYLAQKFYKIRDPDYYEFETHLFFDDAMELSDDDNLVPNMFVGDLMECIDDSLSSVHERQMTLGPPTRTPTPYGGRLTWKLPGGTKLIAHLKDKHKIRHKKRWSQVMYMYYLLGYRILAQPENLLTKDMIDGYRSDGEFQRVKLTESQLRRRRKAAHFTRSVIFNYVTDDVHTQAENTYILTLDGDVDFHPDAVRLLIDSLKTNKKVGAACGRIHPIGSGPLCWYQQFEYAIGHWLQKASEHVFGCVMCAPGCFSLFRGSAMMDDNVARTYATRATEAGHYVQYDQGEDRWLSTLLLQQGYRIDYIAAADALTHAPETFSEFFNQRRRWGPSTLANIIDLLGSWKSTISINDNVSTLYILYQFCMMISTILGPATILLMLAGAFTVVFKTSVLGSYLMALAPAIGFIVICIFASTDTQMTIASIMSAFYAIIMTIVLVGTVGQAIEGGVTSPNVVFLVMLVFIFFVSAIMHPEEFFCVIPGALYFICLPTGYLLLTIYYLCNMNVVSWGTREIPKRKTKEEIEQEKLEAEEHRRKKEEKNKGLLGWMGLNGFFKELGDVIRQARGDVTAQQKKSESDRLLEELLREIRDERRSTRGLSRPPSIMDMADDGVDSCPAPEIVTVENKQEPEPQAKKEEDHVPIWLQKEDVNKPAWLNTKTCGDGPIKRLSEKENIFWKQIIAKYLHPITEDKSHQEKVQYDLKNLRNNVVFGFFMSSALWIALAMQLQILQEDLKNSIFIKIPRLDKDEPLAIEPLGLIFLAFFASILSVQFLGMLFHRWGTVMHMLSITELSCGKTFTEKDKVREIISKAMELQKLCNIENEPMPDYDDPLPDYGYSDEEETLDTTSLATADTWSINPPSYQANMPIGFYNDPHNRKQAIFNNRGNPSGAALRKAFEKRFRNEAQHYRAGPAMDEDRAVALYDIFEHDPANVV